MPYISDHRCALWFFRVNLNKSAEKKCSTIKETFPFGKIEEKLTKIMAAKHFIIQFPWLLHMPQFADQLQADFLISRNFFQWQPKKVNNTKCVVCIIFRTCWKLFCCFTIVPLNSAHQTIINSQNLQFPWFLHNLIKNYLLYDFIVYYNSKLFGT